MYKHCFGIIYPGEVKPQKVVLSFEPFQGKYIKSLPLHETQEVLIDNEKELRISLNIYLTHDFKMEILSFGENVKVIEPQDFAEELKETYKAALEKLSE
jgi:predicted DNA-binding transcriptional regulator YafY